MIDDLPTFRVVPPPPSPRRPRPPEDPAAREARVLAWREHYESGAGFRQAIGEAWALVRRQRFARWAFQEAAQNVGWSTRRLLWAFVEAGLEIPESLRPWAAAHVARYRAERRK